MAKINQENVYIVYTSIMILILIGIPVLFWLIGKMIAWPWLLIVGIFLGLFIGLLSTDRIRGYLDKVSSGNLEKIMAEKQLESTKKIFNLPTNINGIIFDSRKMEKTPDYNFLVYKDRFVIIPAMENIYFKDTKLVVCRYLESLNDGMLDNFSIQITTNDNREYKMENSLTGYSGTAEAYHIGYLLEILGFKHEGDSPSVNFEDYQDKTIKFYYTGGS